MIYASAARFLETSGRWPVWCTVRGLRELLGRRTADPLVTLRRRLSGCQPLV